MWNKVRETKAIPFPRHQECLEYVKKCGAKMIETKVTEINIALN